MNDKLTAEKFQYIIMEIRKLTDRRAPAPKHEYSLCLDRIETIAREAIGDVAWREAVDIVREGMRK